MNLQENIRRVLREDDYSPAGKEITPNKIVIHKSNPKFRNKIIEQGLKASAGECYKIYAGYGEKCIPAIFATNSTNKRAWFDSTYDDDVWSINTELIPNVKWYKDRHFESYKKHIVTFDNIPSEAIELMREGTGNDEFIVESIKRILREEVTKDKNLYGEKLKPCSRNPTTGFYRDGYCKTGDDDTGSHTVCAKVTEEFLEFTNSMGNNLDMLEPGDKWCLCAKRWEEANKEGVAPEMIKSSTNIKTLDIINSVEQELDEYARTLKNARKPSPYLRRRLGMLDYEVEYNFYEIKNRVGTYSGIDICVIYDSGVRLFKTIMENSIDSMYYNYFSHIDDNSGEWAHTYLDMVNYITNKYQDKIMKHYDDNCGSGSIPLKETIRRILSEETQGIDSFLMKVMETYPETESFIGSVESFIRDSNCKKIEVAAFKYPALGLSVHNGVLFNDVIFKEELPDFLFIIFHEIAHQYQYKKYGDEKMYEFYLDETDVKDAAIVMKKIETIADEFANRKVREFVKLGFINNPNKKSRLSIYKDVQLYHFEKLITQTKDMIRSKNVSSFDEIAEIFYNMVKVNDI